MTVATPVDVLTAATSWLAEDPDPTTHAELEALLTRARGNDAAAGADLQERFTGQLEFGTAGLRGVLGAGPQRMNRVLVRKVSAGLAAYVNAQPSVGDTHIAVVGYDGRRNSTVFAEDTARVLAGAGIKVFLANTPWPTPVTAWATTQLGATTAVMVTASHNPPEYNGYKVYWANGAQIVPPQDQGIAAAIAQIGDTRALPMPTLAEARAAGRIEILDDTTLAAYLAGVAALRDTMVGRSHPRRDLRIAYTALHGVGYTAVQRALAEAGFSGLQAEPSQRDPNGEFPTVAFPNPEEPGAMDRVLELARTCDADLVLANDPDADRLAVAVPTRARDGRFVQLTGDQVGALLADFLLTQQRRAADAARPLVATTVVSSGLLQYLAEHHGVAYRETLTGFKWIANAALHHRAQTGGAFVMGYEEALGYSVGELVRDKDGVSAALFFAELAAWNAARGVHLLDHLDEIYRRVGLFITAQVSLTLPGSDGLMQIRSKMATARATPPTEIAGAPLTSIVDLASGANGLPPSNVLIWRTAAGDRVIMRPSGTEPKLKSYFETRVQLSANESMASARARGEARLAALKAAHAAYLG